MNNLFLKIGLLLIVIVSFIIILLGVLFKIMHWSGADTFLIVGMCSQFLVFLVYIIDIIIASINNKWSWIIGGLINPFGGAIIYLANKNDLIKLKELKDKGEI